MKLAGWIFLIFFWSVIILLCAFCFYKIIQVQAKNITPELDINIEPKKSRRKR